MVTIAPATWAPDGSVTSTVRTDVLAGTALANGEKKTNPMNTARLARIVTIVPPAALRDVLAQTSTTGRERELGSWVKCPKPQSSAPRPNPERTEKSGGKQIRLHLPPEVQSG